MVKIENLLNNQEKWVKIASFAILSLFNMLYLKRKHFSHRFQFQTEKVWFVWRKIEKTSLSFFSVKIDADLLSSITNFSNLSPEVWKLSWSMLWKGFEIKSHQGRAQYLKPSKNGRWIYPVWLPVPPPSWNSYNSKVLGLN